VNADGTVMVTLRPRLLAPETLPPEDTDISVTIDVITLAEPVHPEVTKDRSELTA